MATKENLPFGGVAVTEAGTQGAGIKSRMPRKGSGIPIAVSRRNRAKSKPFQDVQSKVNSGANEDIFSKSLPKAPEVAACKFEPESTKEADFTPDPESLKEILKEKPIKSTRQNPRDSKYVIPHLLDNTPACVRLSVYRNRHGKTGGGKTPSYSNHQGRIDLLCERIAQSTAAIYRRKYSIRDSTQLDDVKLDLNLELNKKGALVKSPSHPIINREPLIRPDPIHRSPSLPEIRYASRNQLTEQFMVTPLRTHALSYSSTITPAQLHPSLTRVYDIDNELVSIFRAAPKPCGLARTDCPNPLAGQLQYDCP